MSIRLSDAEILQLLAELKPLPPDFAARLQVRTKRGHKERELDLTGVAGSEFRLILRQSEFNPLDFSAILAYRPPHSTQLFRLRRYNGKSHQHTNILEGTTFYNFHIHIATARYQDESGLREDSYAEETNRYGDFHGAIHCALRDCVFEAPPSAQHALFEAI